MATTQRRQIKLILTFMLVFALLFFICLFDSKMDLLGKLVGCGFTGVCFTIFVNSYIRVLKQ